MTMTTPSNKALIVPDWPAPPNVRALLTTRQGGVSLPPYASFNLGDHVGDDRSAVAANRALLDRAGLSCDDALQALQAEVEALRAARAAEMAQMGDIIDTLDRMAGEPAAAASAPETADLDGERG